MTIYVNESVLEDFTANYQRCTACGQINMLGRTPGGGEFIPSSTVEYTDAVTGKHFYTDSAPANGCAYCGCPNWQGGGKLGDAAHFRHS